MAVEKIANTFFRHLTAPLLIGDSTAHVNLAAPAAVWGGQFRVAIGTELLLVTSGAATTTWTVTRGIEGTAAAYHRAGLTVAHLMTAASLLGATGVFDVRAYGAKFDGVTDDTAAIERASLDATPVKGTIQCPPGTAIVSWADITNTAGYHAGVALRSGCSLRGAGMGATTIKLAANQPDVNAGIVRNWNLDGGDEDITISDLTIDGNGANQSYLYQGIDIVRARNIHHDRVRVVNVRGTAGAPPGETFHFVASSSSDVYYTDCEALGTAGTQGSGFSSNVSTNIVRVNCLARGMSEGAGFADWTSRGVFLANCVAQLNGVAGFNAEVSEGVSYVNCQAGGRAAAGDSNYPFTDGEDLGNGSYGFIFNTTTGGMLNGCRSSYNGDNGAVFVSGSEAQVIGGSYNNNVGTGLSFDDSSRTLCSVSSNVLTPGNAHDFALGALGYAADGGSIAQPAVPASTATLANPYSFPVAVYVTGGTVTAILVNGLTGSRASTPAFAILQPGVGIRLDYSSAPTWTWDRI